MIIGMDFGTTNSGIAAYDGKQVHFIPIDPANQNAAVARTALYITNDRQVYIGRQAVDTYFEQNLNRPVSIEKVRVGEITLTFAELPSFVRDVYIDKDVLSPGRLFLSFKTALSSLNYLGTVVGSHFYFLEDIIALYLYIAKQRAETFLNQEIKQIVLGRPVRFAFDPKDDQLAKERLLKAAFRAGYEKVYLQYEPIAAAYHYESTLHEEQNVLIFDFGGGTLDISILRVGDPGSREVLANGGIPIAGDVFDQKLTRARLPKHFGEDSYYRSRGKRLPVPSNYFEAFSNWQDMLTLQSTDKLEAIERIERTAERPRQIRALRHLISSSYALKMYDKVEAAKRQLSTTESTAIRLDGQDFDVYEPVTRADFERVIRPDIDAVDAYLDVMLNQAGLKSEEIDRVIRTGGSSEIPAFIELLQRRFGQEKVQSIDIFSSVTSGLGMIAHQIEAGQVKVKAYKRNDYELEDKLDNTARNGIPAVDFDKMKKFIALVEPQTQQAASVGLVGLTDRHEVVAVVQPLEGLYEEIGLDRLGLTAGKIATIVAAAPEDSILLGTSDYRFFRKTVQQLARLNDVGLDLAEAEGFQMDIFGDEYVSALSPWHPATDDEFAILVTTSGHYRSFKAESLIARLEQSVAYQPTRLKGDPVTLVTMRDSDQLLCLSESGRAVCISVDVLSQQKEGRVMNISANDQLIGCWPLHRSGNFLLASEDGSVSLLNTDDVPFAGLGTTGAKVFSRKALKSALHWNDEQPVLVVTSERMFPLDPELLDTDVSARLRLPLDFATGETLVALITLTPT